MTLTKTNFMRRMQCPKVLRLDKHKVFIVLHGPDEEYPFLPVDVTKEAKGYYKWINDHIWDLNRRQKEPEEIKVEPGEQCHEPYDCWYYGYCHGSHEENI